MRELGTVIDRLRRDLLEDGGPPAAKEPGADGTWADIDYTGRDRASWQPFRHLERTLALARDPVRHPAALRALDAWGRLDPRADNWWYNEIAVPGCLADILLLTTGAPAPDRLAPWTARLAAAPGTVPLTGQNLVRSQGVLLRRGLLTGDPALVASAAGAIASTLRVTEAEGIQPDLSFHQHGAQLYSGGYGHGFSLDVSGWILALHGTPWAFGPAQVALFTDFTLDGQRWAVHGGGFDLTTMGREVARADAHRRARDGLATVVRRLLAAGAPRAAELTAFARQLAGEGPPPVGSRAYPRSDYLAHRPPGWSLSVRMASTRTAPTESMNGENLLGRHLGDGVAAVRVGDAPEDGYRAVLPLWDWARLPGVTAEQLPDPGALFPRPNGQHGASAHVAVGADGRHAVAALDLTGTDRFTSGRKAWFCFEDCYVALGAGISAPSALHPVVTTVDQRLATGPLTTGQGYAHHGRIGYVALGGGTAPAARVAERSGSWDDLTTIGADTRLTAAVLWTGFDHGPAPLDASYACLVLPGADARTTARRAAAPGVTVLANGPDVQSVRHEATGAVLTVRHDAAGPALLLS
ncbi:polysaccharide lyase family 8 super-sandwich domain-containing protein [Streptomyces avicenniae]|uniref:polysaccharide lyase family 8 super-sandwich domain-containing protein n=1 Tax=Streptomyces avicenniae TaxID=500153 RepID=UPI0006993C2C|nr:polysaccharide lyase family 8 super-sandwich domain-containing protein [Streptomyces avicenniae]